MLIHCSRPVLLNCKISRITFIRINKFFVSWVFLKLVWKFFLTKLMTRKIIVVKLQTLTAGADFGVQTLQIGCRDHPVSTVDCSSFATLPSSTSCDERLVLSFAEASQRNAASIKLISKFNISTWCCLLLA